MSHRVKQGISQARREKAYHFFDFPDQYTQPEDEFRRQLLLTRSSMLLLKRDWKRDRTELSVEQLEMERIRSIMEKALYQEEEVALSDHQIKEIALQLHSDNHNTHKYLVEHMWEIDKAIVESCKKGNAQAQRLAKQLSGELVEKIEQKVKFELSADEHFRIRQEAERRVSELYLGANGDRNLLSKPSLLPQEIREDKR